MEESPVHAYLQDLGYPGFLFFLHSKQTFLAEDLENLLFSYTTFIR